MTISKRWKRNQVQVEDTVMVLMQMNLVKNRRIMRRPKRNFT
jgi:hypothetical protein